MPSSIKSPPAQKSRLRESMWDWPSEIQAWVSPTMCCPASSSHSSPRKDQEKGLVSDSRKLLVSPSSRVEASCLRRASEKAPRGRCSYFGARGPDRGGKE